MKIFNTHGRKNLHRQINHLSFPEVTGNCDYSEKGTINLSKVVYSKHILLKVSN